MRKRRRKRYTWFPNIGSAATIELVEPFSQLLFTITPPANGGLVSAVSPLTIDSPLEGTAVSADDQLSEVLGNEYVIERIVGKCFLSCQSPADDPPGTIFPKSYLIACGFFVARANDDASGGGVNTPIGSASQPELNDNYGPLSLDTVREPWMWRRSWILSTGRPDPNSAIRPHPFVGLGGFGLTQSNLLHGSALDGPHIDIKSVRRVRQDERLWFSVSARTLDNELGASGSPNTVAVDPVAGVLDYRVLGALRRARNSSSF